MMETIPTEILSNVVIVLTLTRGCTRNDKTLINKVHIKSYARG
jgi:hypothetical protein